MTNVELLRKIIGDALNESQGYERSYRLSVLGQTMILRIDHGHGWLSCEFDLRGRFQEYDLIQICQWAIPSFRHFSSVTLVDSRTGRLVLLKRLGQLQIDAVFQAIESLLNQVEVWDQVLARPISRGASGVTRRRP
jgi:hypothetical protein